MQDRVLAWRCKEHDHLSVENQCPSCVPFDVIEAARDTTMQARLGKVCAERSNPSGFRSVYCYCTRERGHQGEHVATTTSGTEVARWAHRTE